MAFSIKMEKSFEGGPRNYSRLKDGAWKLTNGLMAVLFYIAAVLQVPDFLTIKMEHKV